MRRICLHIFLHIIMGLLVFSKMNAQSNFVFIPRVAIAAAIDIDGDNDFYDFANSKKNEFVSAAFDSIVCILATEATNYELVDSQRMRFIPNLKSANSRVIEFMELDYLINISVQTVKKETILSFTVLNYKVEQVAKKSIYSFEGLSPYVLDNVYKNTLEIIKFINNDYINTLAEKQKVKIVEITNLTYTHIPIIEYTDTPIEPQQDGNSKTILVQGDFENYDFSIEVQNNKGKTKVRYDGSQKRIKEKGIAVELQPGLNTVRILDITAQQKIFTKRRALDRTYILDPKYSSLDVIDVGLLNPLTFDIYILINAIITEKYSNNTYPYGDLQIGARFSLNRKSKFNVAITAINTTFGITSAGFTIGYERNIFGLENYYGYPFSVYGDLTILFSSYPSANTGFKIETGVNIRLAPFASFKAGVNYISFITDGQSEGQSSFGGTFGVEFFVPIWITKDTKNKISRISGIGGYN